MNGIVLKLHIISSFFPSILTLVILLRSTLGLIKGREVSRLDLRLPKYVVIFLYVQLVLGIVLYVLHINAYASIEHTDQMQLIFDRRFWAVEHFIMMFFALAFSHIAYIYAKNSVLAHTFYRKSLIYFSTVFVLIVTSLVINATKYM